MREATSRRKTRIHGAIRTVQPTRRALFIDLDNLVIHDEHSVSAVAAHTLIAHALAVAGRVQYRLAVAPRATIQRLAPELAALDVRWEIVECVPDAADDRIIEIAVELVDHGFGEICIVSCDHYFATLGRAARLIVIAPDCKPVARRLLAAASIVHRLPTASWPDAA